MLLSLIATDSFSGQENWQEISTETAVRAYIVNFYIKLQMDFVVYIICTHRKTQYLPSPPGSLSRTRW